MFTAVLALQPTEAAFEICWGLAWGYSIPTGAAFRYPGASTLPNPGEFDVSVFQTSHIEEGAEDGLWHSLPRRAYRAARGGREVLQKDPESGRVARLRDRGMARRAHRLTRCKRD